MFHGNRETRETLFISELSQDRLLDFVESRADPQAEQAVFSSPKRFCLCGGVFGHLWILPLSMLKAFWACFTYLLGKVPPLDDYYPRSTLVCLKVLLWTWCKLNLDPIHMMGMTNFIWESLENLAIFD